MDDLAPRPCGGCSQIAALSRNDDRALRHLKSIASDPGTIIFTASYVYTEHPGIFARISETLDAMSLDDRRVYLWVDKHDAVDRPDKWIVSGLDPYLAFPVLVIGDDQHWRRRTWAAMERTLAKCRCGIANDANQSPGSGLSLRSAVEAVSLRVSWFQLLVDHQNFRRPESGFRPPDWLSFYLMPPRRSDLVPALNLEEDTVQ